MFSELFFSVPMSMSGVATQRSREERDAMGRAVACRLGVAWPPAKRVRRAGRPTADALWEDELQNWTRDVTFGHHDDDVRVQREPHHGWRPGDHRKELSSEDPEMIAIRTPPTFDEDVHQQRTRHCPEQARAAAWRLQKHVYNIHEPCQEKKETFFKTKTVAGALSRTGEFFTDRGASVHVKKKTLCKTKESCHYDRRSCCPSQRVGHVDNSPISGSFTSCILARNIFPKTWFFL